MSWIYAVALLWLVLAIARAIRKFVLCTLILLIDAALAALQFGRWLFRPFIAMT